MILTTIKSHPSVYERSDRDSCANCGSITYEMHEMIFGEDSDNRTARAVVLCRNCMDHLRASIGPPTYLVKNEWRDVLALHAALVEKHENPLREIAAG